MKAPKPPGYAPWSVAAGLRYSEFDHLSERDKKRLARLMARISEASFRRGYQHGVECGQYREIEPGTLRHERSLDRSPFPDSPKYPGTSIERLFMEYGVLRELGFRESKP